MCENRPTKSSNIKTLPCVGIGLLNQAIERPYHVWESGCQIKQWKDITMCENRSTKQTTEIHYHVWESVYQTKQ
jgi:hypothetical protein